MGKVHFVLKETLEEINVSGNRLAVEARIRPNSIYDLLENKKKTISLEHLTAIIKALNTIAHQDNLDRHFDILDVIEYK